MIARSKIYTTSRWATTALNLRASSRSMGTEISTVNSRRIHNLCGYDSKYCSGAYNLPPALKDWLGEPLRCKRNIPTLRVVFGPDKYFFAWDKDGWCWDLEHPALEEFLAKECGPGKDQPKLCALGTGGSYFLVTEKGGYSYDLTGTSLELDKAFDKIACGGRPGAFDHLVVSGFSICCSLQS